MADEKFDPYHAWLGIPKWDRPANAYRLLGIEVFEENRSVIEAAANRQMAYLQELSSGDEHIEEAQKLLGQVSKARVVLLNPEKKAAYDKKLSEQLDSLPDAASQGGGRTNDEGSVAADMQRSVVAQVSSRSSKFDVKGWCILGVLIAVAVPTFLLFLEKQLEVYAVDTQGNALSFIPFTEFSPEDRKKKPTESKLDRLTEGAYPAYFPLDSLKDEQNIHVSLYQEWPNADYPYEASQEDKKVFEKSAWYLFNPAITFTFEEVKPSQITVKVKNLSANNNIIVALDTSGSALPNEIGETVPEPVEPPRVFRMLENRENRGMYAPGGPLYFRSSDRPRVKILNRTSDGLQVVHVSEEIEVSPGEAKQVEIALTGLEKEQLSEKEPQKKKPESSPKPITVSGQFTAEDRDGQKVGIEVKSIKLDINGDGKIDQREIEFRTYTGEYGAFKLNAFTPLPDKVPTLRVDPKYIERFKPIDPVPIPIEQAKDGQLTLEIPPLIRKTITISGTVSTEPAAESAEGFIIFMDRNENGAPDENEPRTTTDSAGNYDFTLPFFIEDYPKSDQGYSLDLVVVGPPPDAKNIEITRDFRNYEKRNPKDWREGVRSANFIATSNDVEIAIPENGMPLDENQVIASGMENPFDAETEPTAFLEHFGFAGDLRNEGGEEKPTWSFQINDELISQFTTAKRAYDKAAKKQNWKKIPELEAVRKNNDAQIEDILTNAKTEAAKTRAQDKVLTYNEANAKIDAELTPLKESRDALNDSVVMAAQAVEQQQQQYQAALDDAEGVKTAATELGISIEPLSRKQQSAWQPALQFLAERKLASLGLQKQGRKWVPTGVAIEADGLRQIKMFAQQNFRDYVQKKQQYKGLIKQNNPANQGQIDKLEKDLDYRTRASTYKTAKKEFDRMTKIYLEHLNTLQAQRAEIESSQETIKETLGGEKKYKAVLDQFPPDKVIEKNRSIITNLQTLVN